MTCRNGRSFLNSTNSSASQQTDFSNSCGPTFQREDREEGKGAKEKNAFASLLPSRQSEWRRRGSVPSPLASELPDGYWENPCELSARRRVTGLHSAGLIAYS